MTTRTLPPSEWARLAETDFPQILPFVDASTLEVIVVEDGARIVGCWGVMPMVHLEGLWIHPDYRGKASVARRLLSATWARVRALAPRWVMTAAMDDRVRRLLTRHMGATAVPAESYLIPVDGVKRCHLLL